jgi:hypothetical protein
MNSLGLTDEQLLEVIKSNILECPWIYRSATGRIPQSRFLPLSRQQTYTKSTLTRFVLLMDIDILIRLEFQPKTQLLFQPD